MVPGREDVEHDMGGEGGEIPNGLYSGDGSPYLLECFRPGPQAQLRPIHGSGMPPQHPPPEGTCQIPWGAQVAPPPTTDRPDKGGQNICGPTKGRPEAPGMRCEEKRVDIGGHVETC